MAVHPLNGAFERINRAEELFVELKRHVDAFGKSYLETVEIYFDPNPPYHAYERTPFVFPRPPSIISILLGEICYNLRCALDYLIFELARFDSGVVQNNTKFPIDDTPQKFASNITSKLKGVSRPHIEAIETLQPYKGRAWIAVLRDISNPDKHRVLTATGQVHIAEIVRNGITPSVAHNVSTKRRAIRPDGTEVEVELIAAISILIPIKGPALGPIGSPIEDALQNLISEIRLIIEAFKPEFE